MRSMTAVAAALSLALAGPASAFSTNPKARANDPYSSLTFSGITIVDTTGSVEVQAPSKPEFQGLERKPFPLGVGHTMKTGTMAKATLQVEDGSEIQVAANSLVKVANPTLELREGRLTAKGAPRWLATVKTAGVPARIKGKWFTIEMPGKGKGQIASLGHGRAAAAKVTAFKGFVEVQLPFGTVRAEKLPITLHEGSVVQTAANSYALIEYADGSRVKLRADSAAVVDNDERVTIAAGSADIQAGPKTPLFEARTADRPARIRGAAFAVQMSPKEDESGPSDKEFTPPPAAVSDLPGAEGWDMGGGR